MGLKRRGATARRQVLDLVTKKQEPQRHTWQTKYQQICAEHSQRNGDAERSGGGSEARANPLQLVGEYQSDSDSQDSDHKESLDAKVSDFLKEIESIVPKEQPTTVPPPAPTAPKKKAAAAAVAVVTTEATAPAATQDLEHPGMAWQECYDEGSGYVYYWNVQTNAVTWEVPPEYQAYATSVDPAQWMYHQQQLAYQHQAAAAAAGYTMGQPPAGPSYDTSYAHGAWLPDNMQQPSEPSLAPMTAAVKSDASDSEEERIEMITSYGPASDEESEEDVPAQAPTRKRKARQGKMQNKKMAQMIGPMFPPEDTGPPGVDSEEYATVTASTRVEKEKPAKIGTEEKLLSVDSPVPRGESDGTDSVETDERLILSRLRSQARILRELGGEIPDEIRQLIDNSVGIASPAVVEKPAAMVSAENSPRPASFALIAGYGDDSDNEDKVQSDSQGKKERRARERDEAPMQEYGPAPAPEKNGDAAVASMVQSEMETKLEDAAAAAVGPEAAVVAEVKMKVVPVDVKTERSASTKVNAEKVAPLEVKPERLALTKVKVEKVSSVEVKIDKVTTVKVKPDKVAQETKSEELVQAEAKSEKPLQAQVKSEKFLSGQVKSEKSLPAQLKSEKSSPEQVKLEKSLPAQGKSEKSLPAQVKMEKSVPAQVKMEKSLPAQVKMEKSLPAQAKIEKSLPAQVKIEKSLPAQAKLEKSLQGQAKSEKLLQGQVKSEKSLPAQVKVEKALPAQAKLEKSLQGQAKSLPAQAKAEKLLPAQAKAEKLLPAQAKSEKLLPAQAKSEKLLQGQAKSEKSVQGQTKSEKMLQGQAKSDKSMQGQTKSEKSLPVQAKSEKSLPVQAKSEKSLPVQVKSQQSLPVQAKLEKSLQGQAKSEKSLQDQAKSEKLLQGQAKSEKLLQGQANSEKSLQGQAKSEKFEKSLPAQVKSEQSLSAQIKSEKMIPTKVRAERLRAEAAQAKQEKIKLQNTLPAQVRSEKAKLKMEKMSTPEVEKAVVVEADTKLLLPKSQQVMVLTELSTPSDTSTATSVATSGPQLFTTSYTTSWPSTGYNADPSGSERRGFGFQRNEEQETVQHKKGTIKFVKAETINLPQQTEGSEEGADTQEMMQERADVVLEKVRFLAEGKEPVPPVQEMAIQIETLVSAWQSGALTRMYLSSWLGQTGAELARLEKEAAPQGWACDWDRTYKRYYYCNLESGSTQWEYPELPGEDVVGTRDDIVDTGDDLMGAGDEMEICCTPPPPPDTSPPPPPPPPQISPCRDPSPPPPPRISDQEPSPPPPPPQDLQEEQQPPLPPLPPVEPPPPPPPDSPPPHEEPLPPGVDTPELPYVVARPYRAPPPPSDLDGTPMYEESTSPGPAIAPLQYMMAPAAPPYQVAMMHAMMAMPYPHHTISRPAAKACPRPPPDLHDELDSFYSDLASLQTSPPAEPCSDQNTPDSQEPVPEPEPAPEPAPAPEQEPLPVCETRKRKKTKLTPGLALKKKGVSSLVAKWQQVQQEVRRDMDDDPTLMLK